MSDATTPSPPRGELFTGDISCTNCGYSLTGLPVGGRCPECGTATGTASARPAPQREPEILGRPLIDAPEWYLRSLHAAFLMMTVSWIVFPILTVLRIFGLSPLWFVPSEALRIVLALCWAGGVMITLQPRPLSIRGKKGGVPIREVPNLRALVATAQVPIVLAPVFGAITSVAANPTPSYVASLVMLVAAVLGYVPTALYLAHVAEWARDQELADRLRAYGWLIGIGMFGGFLIYSAIELQGVIPILPIIASVFWLLVLLCIVISTVLLAISTIRLSNMARWLVINRRTMLERDQRIAEKAARNRAEQDARMAEMDASLEPIQNFDKGLYDSVIAKHEKAEEHLEPSSTPEGVHFANEQRIERTHDEDPYALEGGDDSDPPDDPNRV